MPWCEFSALLHNLPVDSAFRRSIDPDRSAEWGISEQLLVQVHHGIELLRYLWADESSRGNPPEPIPMPWEAAEQRTRDEELVAQLRANAAMN